MLYVVLALLFILPLTSVAEERVTPSRALEIFMQRSSSASAPNSGVVVAEQEPSLPAAPAQVVLEDIETKRRYLHAMQQYYAYRASGYEYRGRLFEWQLWSSRIIFWIVLAVVVAGLVLAAVQFWVAVMHAKKALAGRTSARAGDAKTAELDREQIEVLHLMTQLEVSAKGVIVNSSVVGLIILALSIVFFYLYLLIVYPIVNVF